jgi:aspartate/methionine/tyrosine aminotransferase
MTRIGQSLFSSVRPAIRRRTEDTGAWLAIDYAYKCQYFSPPPPYYSWSPVDHPQLIGIHSNSKWGRGLGRRLGWITAVPHLIEAIERVQQCSLLCPDTLSQMAMTRYLKRAIDTGSLREYIDKTNDLYRQAARVMLEAVDQHLGRPRLEPMGGLYTVVDIGTDADAFVPQALKATGVLVTNLDRIREGLARLGRWFTR